MSQGNKVTSNQLFSVLFLINTTVLLTYSNKLSSSKGILDFVLSSLIFFVLNFILILPTYLLYKKYPRAELLAGPLGVCYRFIYSIYFLWLACYMVCIFKVFVANSMSPEIPTTALTIFMLMASVYAASRDFHAIARTSVVILFIISISLIFMFFSLIPRIEPENYESFMKNGFSDLENGLVYMLSRNFSLPIVTILFPMIEGNKKKTFSFWNIATCAFFILMILVVLGSLGRYAETQLFPVYAVAQIAEVGVFKHLDAIYVGTFAMGVFILVSTFLYFFLFACKNVKSRKMEHRLILVGILTVFIVSCFVPESKNLNYFIFDKTVLLVSTLIVSFVLPFVFLLIKLAERGD